MARAIRGGAGEARRRRAQGAVSRRQLLARCAGADLGHSDIQRRATRSRASCGARWPARRHRTSASTPTARAPRHVTRAGTNAIEAIFRFETAEGRCNGVVRLIPTAGDGAPEGLDAAHRARRDQGPRGAGRQGAADRASPIRATSAGPTGSTCASPPPNTPTAIRPCWWSAAARPGSRSPRGSRNCGVDTLIVDREPRIGDNWRKRYHALTLHNQVHVNHLPYMPFPPSWPTYIPKDKLAGWFEAYVEAMELNYWTGTEFEGGSLRRERRPLVRHAATRDGTSARCARATS